MPGIMKPHEGVCEFYETKVIEGEIICEYFLPKIKKLTLEDYMEPCGTRNLVIWGVIDLMGNLK